MSQDPGGKAIEPGSLAIEDPNQHGSDHTGEAAAEDIGQKSGGNAGVPDMRPIDLAPPLADNESNGEERRRWWP
jgi:hypothetical protein